MRVLVTGSSGFVGKNLVPLLSKNGITTITLDQDPAPSGLPGFDSHIQYQLGSYEDELSSDRLESIDAVVNLAAESHVDRSITGPKTFIDNNVGGMVELLEWCRKMPNLKKFVHFSTDEVGACLEEGSYTEKGMPFDCGSVYSASKGAQELIAQAYIKTHNLPVITTRCVNIFGPHQASEKFLPMAIKRAMADESIPVYGSGMQQRQWVHVDHVCQFVNELVMGTHIPDGSVLHITGTKEIYNLLIAHTVLNLIGKPQSLISHVADRLGHDKRYSLGRTENTDVFGLPVYDDNNFIYDLRQTVDWYVNKYREQL